ncbi:uncharacterized protein PWA37_002798 [Arxiozyma heterogenica]|uniref:uncharacterized protein n=1 Tax=Arxiozyma heterogenica TaxID=278026 RepID=UPI002EF2027F
MLFYNITMDLLRLFCQKKHHLDKLLLLNYVSVNLQNQIIKIHIFIIKLKS